eukprot:gene10992-19831_t
MFTYFGYKGCFPRLRQKSNSARDSRRLSLQEKRKRNISEPIPIVKSSAVVERLLGFNDNNNVFVHADAGSFTESPCHRGFNRMYISETSSTVTEYQNGDSESADDAVFATPRDDKPRRYSTCSFYPPKPPRMKQKRTFMCQKRGCGKTDFLLGRVQVAFKSCSFCFTHYCSAKCQNEDSVEHMQVCFYGSIDAKLTRLSKTLQETDVTHYLSKRAWDGFASKGRGCLFIIFSSVERLDEFLNCRVDGIKFQPTYSGKTEVLKCCVSNNYRRKLLGKISSYNPATHLIVNTAVVVGRRIPNNPVPRNKDVTVRKILVIELNKMFRLSEPEILTVKECIPLDTKYRASVLNDWKRRKSV